MLAVDSPINKAPRSRRYCLITPCRDEAKYARRTLDSIAKQTVQPALWVIVDDGSRVLDRCVVVREHEDELDHVATPGRVAGVRSRNVSTT